MSTAPNDSDVGNGWEWGQHYQLLDANWAEASLGAMAVAPLICRIDKLLQLDGKLLRLSFGLTTSQVDTGFAEVAVFRPTAPNSNIYEPDHGLPRPDTRHYPDKHLVRGNILVSCHLLGSKMQVEPAGQLSLQAMQVEEHMGGTDLRSAYAQLNQQPYHFEARSSESPANRSPWRWSMEELQAELSARGLRTDGNLIALSLRLQAASFWEWFGPKDGDSGPQRSDHFATLMTPCTSATPQPALAISPSQASGGHWAVTQAEAVLHSMAKAVRHPLHTPPPSRPQCSVPRILQSAADIRAEVLQRYGLIDRAQLSALARQGRPTSARPRSHADEPGGATAKPCMTNRPSSAMPRFGAATARRGGAAISRPSSAGTCRPGSATPHLGTSVPGPGSIPPRPDSAVPLHGRPGQAPLESTQIRSVAGIILKAGVTGQRPASALVKGRCGTAASGGYSKGHANEVSRAGPGGWGQFEALLGVLHHDVPRIPPAPEAGPAWHSGTKVAREIGWEKNTKLPRPSKPFN